MPTPRTNPALAAQALVEALPVLIETAAAAGGPLALAVYAMRTALVEATRVAGETAQPNGASTAIVEALRRLGD